MIMTVDELKTYIKTTETDELLKIKLSAIEMMIRGYTNNNFQHTGYRRTADIVGGNLYVEALCPFDVGNTVQISKSELNNGLYTVDEVNEAVFTVNEDVTDEDTVLVTKVIYPADVKMGVVKLMKWELEHADKVGIASETISRHSVSYADMTGDNSLLGYPKALLGFFKAIQKDKVLTMIGGNITARIQVKTGTTTNEIGERVLKWETVKELFGWLDMSSGDSGNLNYNSKIQESTHVFICDHEPLSSDITAENSRMIINNQRYEITLIDNPMELNKQWEIYLRYTGGRLMTVQFNDNSMQVKSAINEAVTAFLHEAAGEIQGEVQRNTRVDTGQTKGSWDYVVEDDTATIGSPLENAIWEEFGTGEHAIEGNGRKGGWAYKDAKGKWHYTKGKKPSRAFWRAFNSLKPKIIKGAEQVIGAKLK